MATRISTMNAARNRNENCKNIAKTTGRAALGDIGNKDKNTLQKKNSLKQVTKKKENHCPTEKIVEEKLANKVESCTLAPNSFSSRLIDVPDIDENDHSDPQLVSELVNDIYDYLRSLELRFPIKRDHLDGKQITGKMRAVLVDWLIQVHQRFRLLPETLYLTIAVTDRYLQYHLVCYSLFYLLNDESFALEKRLQDKVNDVSRSKLQLVGVTAMFIASKFEELYAPEIGDFVYITANTFTKAEILRMECFILKAIDFSLGRPLPLHFLRRYSKAGKSTPMIHTLAKYLMELTLTEYNMVHYEPSKLAAAGLCLARKLVDNKPWSDTLVFYSKYEENTLHPIIQQMAKNVVKAETSNLGAVKTKYSSSSYMKISVIPELKSDNLKNIANGSF